jgi:hypothetical protein
VGDEPTMLMRDTPEHSAAGSQERGMAHMLQVCNLMQPLTKLKSTGICWQHLFTDAGARPVRHRE